MVEETALMKIAFFIAQYKWLDKIFSRFYWYNNAFDTYERLWEDIC